MFRSPQSLSKILIGPPLETAAAAHQSISKKVGLVKMIVNGFGAALTAVVMVVFAVTKFPIIGNR